MCQNRNVPPCGKHPEDLGKLSWNVTFPHPLPCLTIEDIEALHNEASQSAAIYESSVFVNGSDALSKPPAPLLRIITASRQASPIRYANFIKAIT